MEACKKDKEQIKEDLMKMRLKYAKLQKKLTKSEKATRVRAHVKKKVKEQGQFDVREQLTCAESQPITKVRNVDFNSNTENSLKPGFFSANSYRKRSVSFRLEKGSAENKTDFEPSHLKANSNCKTEDKCICSKTDGDKSGIDKGKNLSQSTFVNEKTLNSSNYLKNFRKLQFKSFSDSKGSLDHDAFQETGILPSSTNISPIITKDIHSSRSSEYDVAGKKLEKEYCDKDKSEINAKSSCHSCTEFHIDDIHGRSVCENEQVGQLSNIVFNIVPNVRTVIEDVALEKDVVKKVGCELSPSKGSSKISDGRGKEKQAEKDFKESGDKADSLPQDPTAIRGKGNRKSVIGHGTAKSSHSLEFHSKKFERAASVVVKRKKSRYYKAFTAENINMKALSQGNGDHTLIEGLMFPVEYYVRETRSMSRCSQVPTKTYEGKETLGKGVPFTNSEEHQGVPFTKSEDNQQKTLTKEESSFTSKQSIECSERSSSLDDACGENVKGQEVMVVEHKTLNKMSNSQSLLESQCTQSQYVEGYLPPLGLSPMKGLLSLSPKNKDSPGGKIQNETIHSCAAKIVGCEEDCRLNSCLKNKVNDIAIFVKSVSDCEASKQVLYQSEPKTPSENEERISPTTVEGKKDGSKLLSTLERCKVVQQHSTNLSYKKFSQSKTEIQNKLVGSSKINKLKTGDPGTVNCDTPTSNYKKLGFGGGNQSCGDCYSVLPLVSTDEISKEYAAPCITLQTEDWEGDNNDLKESVIDVGSQRDSERTGTNGRECQERCRKLLYPDSAFDRLHDSSFDCGGENQCLQNVMNNELSDVKISEVKSWKGLHWEGCLQLDTINEVWCGLCTCDISQWECILLHSVASMVLWIGRGNSEWRAEWCWQPPKNEKITYIALAACTEEVFAAFILSNKIDQTYVRLMKYNIITGEDDITLIDMPQSLKLLSEPQVVSHGSTAVLLDRSDSKVLQYHGLVIGSEFCKSVSLNPVVLDDDSCLHDIVAVCGLCDVYMLVADRYVTLWSVSSDTCLGNFQSSEWNIKRCFWVKAEKGLLFLVVFMSYASMSGSQSEGLALMVLNPNTGKMVQLHQYRMSCMHQEARIKEVHVTMPFIVALFHDGNMLWWDLVSSRCLSEVPAGHQLPLSTSITNKHLVTLGTCVQLYGINR